MLKFYLCLKCITALNLKEEPKYIPNSNLDDNFYDIGEKSYNVLLNMINDAEVIFWNGSALTF